MERPAVHAGPPHRRRVAPSNWAASAASRSSPAPTACCSRWSATSGGCSTSQKELPELTLEPLVAAAD